MSAAPVFIVGTMRSGSTLLRLLLDSHSAISIGPESGFMRAVEAIRSVPDWSPGTDWWRRYDLDEHDLDAHIRRLYDDVFGGYAAARGKRRWGEKTPFHLWHVMDMARLFPDAQFVAIVRHPAATVVSTRRWSYSLDDAVSKWVRGNATIVHHAHRLGPLRFAVVRYEDLVTTPRACLEGLLGFLGEPWDDAVLRHGDVQQRQGAPGTVEGGTRPGDAIDRSRAGRWHGQLTGKERDLLRGRIPAELLRVLGYALDAPEPRVRAAVAGHPITVADADRSLLPDGKLATGAFDPQRTLDGVDPAELAHRLVKAERRLAQLQTPLGVRLRRHLRSVRGQPLSATLRRVSRRAIRGMT